MKTLNQTPEHPANEELAAFALGKETPNAETIAEHVANCVRCETLIAKTPRDTFLGILNKAKPGDSLTGPYAPKADPTTANELPEELRQQTKYTFLKKLGGGGMGVVYLAEHNLMKRKVAVKLIPPELIGNPAVRERFLQEVVSAAALEHPNVVRAYSAEEFGQHMLFEMEFVDGKDLGEVVKLKGPLPVNFAVNYIRQAAQALQQGMLKGLVHRDIKPGNLMLTRAGSVKVADFGLAKFSRETDKAPDRSLTGVNAMMGTPDYMAPEQSRDAKNADIRADIYSLGCTFCYLLTGQPPFAAVSIADLILKHWDDPRPDVGLLRNDVPPELSRYIQKMMAKEPGDRPQSPKEVVDWLGMFGKGEPTKNETVVTPSAKTLVAHDVDDSATESAKTRRRRARKTRQRPKKKWPLIAGSIGCLLLALVIFAAAGAFRVKTREGAIVLENLPPDAEVLVNGDLAIVTSNGQSFEVRVAAGRKHRLQVKRDGFKTFGTEVEVETGGSKSIVVHLDPIRVTPKIEPKEVSNDDVTKSEQKKTPPEKAKDDLAKVPPTMGPTFEPLPDPSGRKPGEIAEVVIPGGLKIKFCWIPPGKATLVRSLAKGTPIHHAWLLARKVHGDPGRMARRHGQQPELFFERKPRQGKGRRHRYQPLPRGERVLD